MKFGIGQSPRRVEDHRLLTGSGRYTDDIQAAGTLFAATVRSPYGHARIVGIDTTAAQAVPGVVAVYTHTDIAAYGVVPCVVPFSGKIATPRHLLTGDRVRFVGDGVAFVVADTREAARAGVDERNAVADEAHPVAGQQMARRRDLAGERHDAGNDAAPSADRRQGALRRRRRCVRRRGHPGGRTRRRRRG